MTLRADGKTEEFLIGLLGQHFGAPSSQYNQQLPARFNRDLLALPEAPKLDPQIEELRAVVKQQAALLEEMRTTASKPLLSLPSAPAAPASFEIPAQRSVELVTPTQPPRMQIVRTTLERRGFTGPSNVSSGPTGYTFEPPVKATPRLSPIVRVGLSPILLIGYFIKWQCSPLPANATAAHLVLRLSALSCLSVTGCILALKFGVIKDIDSLLPSTTTSADVSSVTAPPKPAVEPTPVAPSPPPTTLPPLPGNSAAKAMTHPPKPPGQ